MSCSFWLFIKAIFHLKRQMPIDLNHVTENQKITAKYKLKFYWMNGKDQFDLPFECIQTHYFLLKIFVPPSTKYKKWAGIAKKNHHVTLSSQDDSPRRVKSSTIIHSKVIQDWSQGPAHGVGGVGAHNLRQSGPFRPALEKYQICDQKTYSDLSLLKQYYWPLFGKIWRRNVHNISYRWFGDTWYPFKTRTNCLMTLGGMTPGLQVPGTQVVLGRTMWSHWETVS